ncbi:hypothetical protein PITCH_A1260012 [uncultured Desulfobacterium sp.]|uniref:Uncharacterized protein n=1 Tax=uncultured Desulfobacterium sp. TaxID=201089 RepID=A0A445MRX8_9BACT|nr:hypothetical protein PITCH_A1260012 [uncultured Desulfobacterium sp.]
MEHKDKKPGKKKKKKSSEDEKKLPFCTKAASAEHARSYDEDEPCDDGRAGETGEE